MQTNFPWTHQNRCYKRLWLSRSYQACWDAVRKTKLASINSAIRYCKLSDWWIEIGIYRSSQILCIWSPSRALQYFTHSYVNRSPKSSGLGSIVGRIKKIWKLNSFRNKWKSTGSKISKTKVFLFWIPYVQTSSRENWRRHQKFDKTSPWNEIYFNGEIQKTQWTLCQSHAETRRKNHWNSLQPKNQAFDPIMILN